MVALDENNITSVAHFISDMIEMPIDVIEDRIKAIRAFNQSFNHYHREEVERTTPYSSCGGFGCGSPCPSYYETTCARAVWRSAAPSALSCGGTPQHLLNRNGCGGYATKNWGCGYAPRTGC